MYKGVAPIDEDFFAVVCYLSFSILATLYGLTFMIIPGKSGINYYMCTGEDPIIDPYSTKKFPINAMVPAFSMLLYFYLNWRISRYKKKIAMEAQQQQMLQDSEGQIQPCLNIQNLMQKTSLSYFSTIVRRVFCLITSGCFLLTFSFQFLVSTMALHSLAWGLIVGRMSPKEIMDTNLGMIKF